MTKLPIYLINLDGSDARLSAATAALQRDGMPFVRHPAYDGRSCDLSRIPEYDANGALADIGRNLTGGEVGCFISHVQVATAFLQSDATCALVLEDDMRPLPGWQAMIEALSAGDMAWDIVHLAAEKLKIATPICDLTSEAHRATMHRAHYFPMRTTALLWSRKGAERFVRSAYPITCPVDIHLRRLMQQNDGGVAIAPPCFTTTQAASEIVTTNGTKRGEDSRSVFYPVKRASRVLSENMRASTLRRRARKGA